MELIQDSDYILFKALSESILKGLEKPIKKLEIKIEALVTKFEKIRSKFLSCETYDDLGLSSNELSTLKAEIIKLCSVHDRMEKIIERNKQRLAYYQTKLDALGIYNYQVDKKDFSESVKREKDNISEMSLNLNPYKSGITYKFFAGRILAFKDNILDFSIEENESSLMDADAGFFREMVETFPFAIGTIPDKFYMSLNVRYNVLKECILFAASKNKKQSIQESNKELGGLLANSSQIVNIADYAKALNNYLQVSVKKYLKDNVPDMADDIDKNIKCNEASEFLPSSKRVAVLANGLAGDVPKTEAEESEEVRKEQEESAKQDITRQELLDMLLADDEDDLEMQAEAQEEERKAEEARKLNEEKEEQMQEEELERQLELGLKKNDVVDD